MKVIPFQNKFDSEITLMLLDESQFLEMRAF